MRRNILLICLFALIVCRPAVGVAAEADSTEVTGTLILPATVGSIKGSVVEIRLYEYDPRIADKAATLVDKVQIKGFQHTQGKETKREFSIGKKPPEKLDPKMRYYVTLFIHPGDPDKTPRTHMGEATHRKGLCLVLTQDHPRQITMKVREVDGARPKVVRPAPRPMPGRPMPGRPMPMPGRPRPGKPGKQGGGSPFATFQQAQLVFTAELKKAKAGPVAKSYPPIYSHKLILLVKEVLRGELKAGQEITGHHSARQLKRPTFPVGELCIVAAQKSRGSLRVQLIRKAEPDVLKTARLATSLPMGWSIRDGKLLSPWAKLGAKAWPKIAAPAKGQTVCSVTGRPALLAGEGVKLKVEQVPPPIRIKWTNPDGDGKYRITVANTTGKPLAVPALLSDGTKILWNESLVVICQGKARPAPGAKGVSAAPKPAVLKAGEEVSTTVNAFLLKNIRWPRGGYRIEFQFCLGELSSTQSFYYMSRHHDKIRAAAVKKSTR